MYLKTVAAFGLALALVFAPAVPVSASGGGPGTTSNQSIEIDATNRQALVRLILALTDQFGRTASTALFKEARELVAELDGEYERMYYEGIVCERRGKSHFERRQPGSGQVAHEWYEKAMEWFAKAEALHPPNVEDAKLRWNTCARMLMKHDSIRAPEPDTTPQLLE